LALKNVPPGIRADKRYRTVSEQQIIDILLVAAFVSELEAGQRASATARISAALDTWIELGLGYQLSDRGERMFDPVEVVNRMKWTGYHGLDDFWINHFVATSRAFAGEWDAAESGVVRRAGRRDPARFSLHLRRSFNLTGIEAGQKLRLRLPLPISQSSDQVEVEPIAPADMSARVNRSEGRLDFQFAAPSEPAVAIAANIAFTTDGRSKDDLPGGARSDAAGIYLRASEGLIRVTPRIQALSQAIAGTEQDPFDVATGLFHYLIDELMCGMVHYDQVNADAPGDWVLDSRWYDCQLGSALLVSMCRARGIPARIMSGHMLYRLAPGFHYWAEVWIDGQGWLPFDFLTWDLSKAGRDVAWRDFFAGSIDYRMTTQCFPQVFTGPMSVRFPPAWHLVNAPTSDGMEISFTELDGKLIYRDHVTSRKHAH
jgi:Transglutaminase-like superfamily